MNKVFIFLLTFLFFQMSITFATHIVGGEITYQRIGTSNDYKVQMNFVRDCSGPNAFYDDTCTIYVLDGQSLQVVQTLNALAFYTPLNYINFSIPPCFSPINICYDYKTMSINTTLPPNPNGYWLTYGRCCRNATIKNIYLPLETGFTLSTFIPSTNIINSSPTFNLLNPNLVCVGDSLNVLLNASDADGDSLVYEFADIYVGGSNTIPIPTNVLPTNSYVNWLPNYNSQNPFGINSYTSLNSQTGNLKALCNQIGQYVFSIKAKEYRNGVLLGETRREMELNVVNCQNYDTPPHFNITNTSVSLLDTIYFYANTNNYADFTMYDFKGNSIIPEPLIYGELTGGIFDNQQFTNFATASNQPSGVSPLNGTISMFPTNADTGRIIKNYVHIWRTDSCFSSNLTSLLDSFYVRIMPCGNRTPPPTITGVEQINTNNIFIDWQTYPTMPDFGYYIIERTSDNISWNLLSTFYSNTSWAYFDTTAYNNDSIPYCYRLGVVSLCEEENEVHYSTDSCTFSIQTITNNTAAKIHCYPNPNKSEDININVADFKGKDIQLKVINAFGKIVYEKYYNKELGENIYLPLNNLEIIQGIYYIQVISQEDKPQIATTKLVFQNK